MKSRARLAANSYWNFSRHEPISASDIDISREVLFSKTEQRPISVAMCTRRVAAAEQAGG